MPALVIFSCMPTQRMLNEMLNIIFIIIIIWLYLKAYLPCGEKTKKLIKTWVGTVFRVQALR